MSTDHYMRTAIAPDFGSAAAEYGSPSTALPASVAHRSPYRAAPPSRWDTVRTGILSEQLAATGVQSHAVEPDPRMA